MFKLQVNVSDEMVLKLDKYAKLMGVSRSALCAMMIGQAVLGYEKSFEVLDKFGDNLKNDISALIEKKPKQLGN